MEHRLTVVEHHSKLNGSEVVRVDIDTPGLPHLVVEHLASRRCIIIDLFYGNDSFDRRRIDTIYYDEEPSEQEAS